MPEPAHPQPDSALTPLPCCVLTHVALRVRSANAHTLARDTDPATRPNRPWACHVTALLIAGRRGDSDGNVVTRGHDNAADRCPAQRASPMIHMFPSASSARAARYDAGIRRRYGNGPHGSLDWATRPPSFLPYLAARGAGERVSRLRGAAWHTPTLP